MPSRGHAISLRCSSGREWPWWLCQNWAFRPPRSLRCGPATPGGRIRVQRPRPNTLQRNQGRSIARNGERHASDTSPMPNRICLAWSCAGASPPWDLSNGPLAAANSSKGQPDAAGARSNRRGKPAAACGQTGSTAARALHFLSAPLTGSKAKKNKKKWPPSRTRGRHLCLVFAFSGSIPVPPPSGVRRCCALTSCVRLCGWHCMWSVSLSALCQCKPLVCLLACRTNSDRFTPAQGGSEPNRTRGQACLSMRR
jgi:hypothetical protein